MEYQSLTINSTCYSRQNGAGTRFCDDEFPCDHKPWAVVVLTVIRVATPNDGDSVTALLQASYPVLMRDAYEQSVLGAALPMMTVAQPGLLQSGSYYVADAGDGLIVGCGGWTRERPGTGEVVAGLAHIRHFGVHPEWTRQGIGQSIYTRCRDDARAAGVESFECYSSINGEAFYAALGFARVERIEVEMLDGLRFPSIRMVAELPG